MTNERVRPPEIGLDSRPLARFYCHTNAYAGGEGLTQKLWTLTTCDRNYRLCGSPAQRRGARMTKVRKEPKRGLFWAPANF